MLAELLLSLLCVGTATTTTTTRPGALDDPLLVDLVKVWQQFRDPGTGFWCDTLRFQNFVRNISI